MSRKRKRFTVKVGSEAFVIPFEVDKTCFDLLKEAERRAKKHRKLSEDGSFVELRFEGALLDNDDVIEDVVEPGDIIEAHTAMEVSEKEEKETDARQKRRRLDPPPSSNEPESEQINKRIKSDETSANSSDSHKRDEIKEPAKDSPDRKPDNDGDIHMNVGDKSEVNHSLIRFKTLEMSRSKPETLKLDFSDCSISKLKVMIAAKLGLEYKESIDSQQQSDPNIESCSCSRAEEWYAKCPSRSIICRSAIVDECTIDCCPNHHIADKALSKQSCGDCPMCKTPLITVCLKCHDGDSAECDLVVGTCGHMFHSHCLSLSIRGSRRCPVDTAAWKFRLFGDEEKRDLSDGLLRVFVNIDGVHRVIAMPHSTDQTIPQLRKSLDERLQVHFPNGYYLRHSGKDISRSKKSMGILRIRDGDVVTVCGVNAHDRSLQVKCSIVGQNAENVVLDVSSKDTIYDLKSQIQQRCGILKDRLLVIRQGKILKQSHHTLAQCGIDMNDNLTISTEGRPDFEMELFTATRYILPRSASGAHSTLLEAGLQPNELIYVVLRTDYRQSANNDAHSFGDNMQTMLGFGVNWLPMPVTQTDKGMSCFLSCLYVLASNLKTKISLQNKILGHFRAILEDFSPAVLALKVVLRCKPSQLTGPLKAALSSAVYLLLKQMVPTSVPSQSVFEYCRVFFCFLISFAKKVDKDTEKYKAVDLTCGLSHSRLCNPVYLKSSPGVLYSKKSIIKRIESKSGIFADRSIEEYAECKSTERLLRTYPNAHEVFVWDVESAKKKEETPKTDESKDDDDDGDATMASSSSSRTFLYSWTTLVRSSTDKGCKSMRLVSTLSLVRTRNECLTLDKNGNVVVCTAGSGSIMTTSTILFCPLLCNVSTINPQTLAQLTSKFEENQSTGDFFEDDRPPLEAILVCLDVSSSMGGTADFDDEEDESDDEGFEKENPTNSSETAVQEALKKFRAHPNLVDLRAIAKDIAQENGVDNEEVKNAAAEEVLREICVLERNKGSGVNYRRLISKYTSKFAEVLLEDEAKAPPENTGADVVPNNFQCPITRQLMQDPVVLGDGFTYERSAITQWLTGHETSPMLGNALGSTNVTPNNNLKAQINEWKARRDQLRRRNEQNRSEDQDQADNDEPIMQVFVSRQIGGTLTIDVKTSYTVIRLKEVLQRRTGIPADKIRLKYGGVSMRDHLTLQDIGVQRESTLRMSMNLGMSIRNFVVCVNITDKRLSQDQNHVIAVCGNETVEGLLIRIWRTASRWTRRFRRPSQISLWKDLKPKGDGWLVGTLLNNQRTVYSYAENRTPSFYQTSSPNSNFDGTLTIEIKPKHIPKSQRKKMTRLETVKQLFNAFINRSQAYDVQAHIGLMLFHSTYDLSLKFTSLYEDFRDHVDKAIADGDTCLYDALGSACDHLKRWQEKHKDAKLRILCLSDGKDTKSSIFPWKVCQKLQTNKVVVDAICIGSERDSHLRGIVKATNGYIFLPTTLKNALKLCELETLLCQMDRTPKSPKKVVISARELRKFCDEWKYPVDICTDNIVPKRRETEKINKRVLSLESAFQNAQDADEKEVPTSSSNEQRQIKSQGTKRLMQEMKHLLKHPHPAFDVFPCEEDLYFWRLTVEGPDGTPYTGGVFLLYIQFPDDYPRSAPTMRFITPIKHCNINSYGRVCHSIFDRNYTSDTSISTILQCVYGLLLQPDVSQPLDSTLALEFYDDSGVYESSIVDHVATHAKEKTRAEWKAHFERMMDEDDDTTNKNNEQSPECARPGCNEVQEVMLKCRRCKKVNYCSVECERQNRLVHREHCSE